MKHNQTGKQALRREKNGPIRTTFIELIGEITKLTGDDALVLAVVENILGTYRVRLSDTVAPVRLVGAQRPITRNSNHAGQRLPLWA